MWTAQWQAQQCRDFAMFKLRMARVYALNGGSATWIRMCATVKKCHNSCYFVLTSISASQELRNCKKISLESVISFLLLFLTSVRKNGGAASWSISVSQELRNCKVLLLSSISFDFVLTLIFHFVSYMVLPILQSEVIFLFE